MTEQLDIAMDDEQDQSTDSSLCDDPDKCPLTMCGCRWLQTGDAWANNNERQRPKVQNY